MQVLKQEVQEAILISAKNEFLNKGFIGSSMRVIAKNAGITAGNLYRYFKNKEEIFEKTVQPAIDSFYVYWNEHNKAHEDFYNKKKPMNRVLEEHMKLLEEYILKYREEMIILKDCSKGTKYENTSFEINRLYIEHVKDHLIKNRTKIDVDEKDAELLANAISTSFNAGFFTLLKSETDIKRLIELTKKFSLLLAWNF